MKRFVILALVALSLITLGLPSATRAAPVSLGNALYADVIFSVADDAECVFTNAYLTALTGTTGPGQPQEVALAKVELAQYNSCTGESFISTEDVVRLDAGALQIDRKLNTASLNVSTEVTDFVSGTRQPVAINITWTGVGDTRSDRYQRTDRGRQPLFLNVKNLAQLARTAEVTGTIMTPWGDFAAEPAVSGLLASVRSVELWLAQSSRLELGLLSATEAAQVQQFTGGDIDAEFGSVDASGCIATQVLLSGIDGTSGPGQGQPITFVDYLLSKYDFCTEEQLAFAYGSATLEPDAIQVDQTLNYATLDATVQVNDQVSGTSYPVAFNIAWTGTGNTFYSKLHQRRSGPDYMENGHFRLARRGAEVFGTVTSPWGTVTPSADAYASLIWVSTADVSPAP